MKRLWPRYAIVATLLTGLVAAFVLGMLDFSLVEASLAKPELTTPAFSLGAVIGLGVPLFLLAQAAGLIYLHWWK